MYVHHNDEEGAQHVHGGHNRSEHAGNPPDAANASQNDHAYDGRSNDPRNPGRHAKFGGHHVRHRIGLHGVTRKKGGDPQQHGEKHGKGFPAAAQAALDIIHRPARHRALLARRIVRRHYIPVMLRKRNLRILGGHAQERGNPHPENRAGTAPVDGDGYARDIADAHRRRKRRGERLKMGYVAGLVGVVVPAGRNGEPVPQATNLNELQPERQEYARAQEQNNDKRDRFAADRRAERPHGALQGGNDPFENIHTIACLRK